MAEVFVQEGEQVTATQVIARVTSAMHRRVHVVDVAGALDLPGRDVSSSMVKQRGETVHVGELLAVRRSPVPFAYRACRAPVAGRLVVVWYGWAVIETGVDIVDIPALVDGYVVTVAPGRSVIIETEGTCIEGICGIAGEAYGVLRLIHETSSEQLSPEQLPENATDAILVTNVAVSHQVLERAVGLGVRGLVAAGIPTTASETVSLPVMATEGYGVCFMAPERFRLLQELEGCYATLIVPPEKKPPWLHHRPAVIVTGTPKAHSDSNRDKDAHLRRPIRKGDQVRVVRAPMMTRWGSISKEEWDRPLETPSGLTLAGVEVRFSTSDVAWLPYVNLERVL
jgi:hypothetical protein